MSVDYLLDTSYLYALINKSDLSHKKVLSSLASVNGAVYLPTVAVTEVAYLIGRDIGSPAVADFLDALVTGDFVLVEPESEDLQRAASIIRKYHDAHIDLVDAVLAATAERLNITHILTLDQRHFRLFRPNHAVAFEIIP